jgi:hypothetical protein
MNKTFISRSAFETYDVCARKYYYSFEHQGTGVSSKYFDIDLLVGSCIHRGLQNLLEHCRLDHPNGDFTETCVDDSVKIALELYEKTISECDLSKKSFREDLGFTLISHRYLIEGLIYAYAFYRLPNFLKEYQVLEVEKEEIDVDFSSGKILLGKADFIALNKRLNKIVVGSYKTASEYSDSTQRDLLIDMQGNSECYLVGKRYNRLKKEIFEDYKQIKANDYKHYNDKYNITKELYRYIWAEVNKDCIETANQFIKEIEVELVQYEHLIKGQRKEYPEKSGFYLRNTPILHPYKYDTGLHDTNILPKHFKLFAGKGRLPAGLNRVNIWEHLPMKVWIQWLMRNEIQPEHGDILKDIIISADLIKRGKERQLEWYQSYSKVCDDITQGLNALEIVDEPYNFNDKIDLAELDKARHSLLNIYFRKETKSCTNYYGKDCVYFNICHNGIQIDEAIEDGLYQTRKPHHDDELNLFKEKGYIKDEI